MGGPPDEATGQAVSNFQQQVTSAATDQNGAKDDKDQNVSRDDLKRLSKNTACFNPDPECHPRVIFPNAAVHSALSKDRKPIG